MKRVAFKMYLKEGQKEIVQRWWDHMADIMEVNPDNSPVSEELEEVFYLP
ncbi:MAG: L-rhamnose mutarotase [Bacteroidales bacterium]|nr:L-rhamnose mutarotase [Bacteroidales bacterium]